MRSFLSIVASFALVAGCPKPSTDGDTDVSDTDDTDALDTDVVGTEVTGPAKIFDSCGPADGPALVLSPGQTEDTCLTENDGASTHPLRMDIVSALPTSDALPHTITLGSDFRSGGIATYCPTPDTCVGAISGSVTFTEYEHGVKAVGTYTVTLPDGEVLWGAFDASWCVVELWCG
jgi:hypothetical protein